MAKNNGTVDRIQAVWNMIGGDNVVDLLIAGAAKLKVEHVLYTRFLDSLILAPTKGTLTIVSAIDVFAGYIGSDFTKWGTNRANGDTKEVMVDVREMHKDGTFKQLFGSLGVSDPRQLCLTQGQIVEFCRTHRDHLHQDGYGTFFLFEGKDKVLFVAYVRLYDGGLKAYMYRFGDGSIWNAAHRYRLVVRQWTT